MTLIEKTDSLFTSNTLIDNDHDEFIKLLTQLDSASKADFPALFQQLYEHTEHHFERENQLMSQLSFPAEGEHKGEHLRVLGEFRQFKSRVDKGLITFGRAFVKDRLPEWFRLHVTTMDSALVAHIKTKNDSLR
jgi:hemerythrin